jgi:hypothetical protein
MALASKTFRIFVSSTFSDLKEERNALQQRVFPRLRELCAQHGARFQAIDLRWGVSEEAGLDQRTMNICFDEIGRCRKTTPRPNFVLLLGDRYGWRPLPPAIPAHEFNEICTRISADERKRLEEWYQKDDNTVPSEYCLKPREPGGEYEDYDAWSKVEADLRSILLKGVKDMPLEERDRLKYEASATEQEIHRGALRVPDAREHVFCFFRTINTKNDKPLVDDLPPDGSARDFVDQVKADGQYEADSDAHDRQEALKSRLRGLFLGNNIYEYGAGWTGSGITTTHLDKLCDDVYGTLSRIITQELERLEEVDPLDKEIADHDAFAEDRARVFIGRAAILEAIAGYLNRADEHPLAIHGASGSGKSALMARSVQQARGDHPGAEVIVRFIGATPESSDGRALLQSLCLQISRRYGADESTVPTDYRELVDEFPKRLALATADRPLILFLDALDQLTDAEGARSLVWLPAELPEHVRLVVSTLPGECLSVLENKLPAASLVELEPMPVEEGQALLDVWLEEASRALQPQQREEVLGKFTRNGLPLYLKLAFEETRLWKSYTPSRETELQPDIPSIIRQLFKRLSDQANHGQVMVERSLAYLAAAKNGLSEDEMLDVLSNDADVLADFKRRSPKSPDVDRLPVVIWSRLYFDLEPYLTERSADGASLLGFYHRQLGEVTADDYLAGDAKLPRHRLLADYFGGAPLEIQSDDGVIPNLRKLSELPYQQTMGELWARLHVTLTDFRFLETKAAVGAMETTDAEGNKTVSYSGAALLQEDFRLALEKFPLS